MPCREQLKSQTRGSAKFCSHLAPGESRQLSQAPGAESDCSYCVQTKLLTPGIMGIKQCCYFMPVNLGWFVRQKQTARHQSRLVSTNALKLLWSRSSANLLWSLVSRHSLHLASKILFWFPPGFWWLPSNCCVWYLFPLNPSFSSLPSCPSLSPSPPSPVLCRWLVCVTHFQTQDLHFFLTLLCSLLSSVIGIWDVKYNSSSLSVHSVFKIHLKFICNLRINIQAISLWSLMDMYRAIKNLSGPRQGWTRWPSVFLFQLSWRDVRRM